MAAKITNVDVDDLVRRYNSGESVKALAKFIGHSRQVVRRLLQSRGITVRNRSESMLVRMSRTPESERKRLTDAAHAAVRGTRRSFEELVERAITRERRGRGIDPSERALLAMLNRRGVLACPQKAVGPYNVDLAIAEPSIAVEVFGGAWHRSGRHLERFVRRFKYILDAGFSTVIIWNDRRYPLSEGAADYVVTLCERLGKGETMGREHHVIRGDGQPTSRGKDKLNYWAVVGHPHDGENVSRVYPR